MSGGRPNRSLAARRGRPYDKGRGFAWQMLWVASSTLVFTQVWCPNRLRCAILRWFGAQIGDGVLIRHQVTIQWPWKLSIGDNSWIGTGSELYNLDDIVIGSDVCISQRVFLCTGSHDRSSPTFEFDNAPIIIDTRMGMRPKHRPPRCHHRCQLRGRGDVARSPRHRTGFHCSGRPTHRQQDVLTCAYCRWLRC